MTSGTGDETYEKARERTACILYVRNRIAGELDSLRADAARLHASACAFLREGHEQLARARLVEREARLADVSRAEQDLHRLQADAEAAKAGLIALLDRARASERERLIGRANELSATGAAERWLVEV